MFSNIWSKRFSKSTSYQVPWDFPPQNGQANTKNPLLRNQMMSFNVCITGCYFHTCFILLANCDIKHISRSNHSDVSPKVLPKVTHKLFKNRKSWFKIQAKVLKNICKGFFASSVVRTTSIIWDAFSSSNKLFSFQWAHHQ